MTVLLGVVLILLGILCVGAPRISGLASVVYLGVLLGLSGLVELFAGIRDREAEHRGVLLAGGLFSLAVGVLMTARPQAGLAALTLLLAGFLIATGLHRALSALFARYPGRGWDLASGVVTLILGVIAIASWPISALWLIGTLVGIEIISRGATLVALGFGLDRPLRTPAARPA